MSKIEIENNSLYKTYAYFYVSDFEGDVSEITRKVELEPTETWLKEDAWYYTQRPRPFSGWKLYSTLDSSEIFLDAHINAILDLIEPKREQILELQAQGCKIGINCVGYYYSANPGFSLSAKLLSRLAKFSFDVDFDLYCLCADDGEVQETSKN